MAVLFLPYFFVHVLLVHSLTQECGFGVRGFSIYFIFLFKSIWKMGIIDKKKYKKLSMKKCP